MTNNFYAYLKPALLSLALSAVMTLPTPIFASSGLLEMYKPYEADTLTDLTKSHRSVREVSEWLSSMVADSLIFRPGTTREKLEKIRPYFTESGYQAYMRFLGTTSYADLLRNDTLNLSTIVNNTPLLIGQGTSGGRHAWAFELPVIMTPLGSNAVRPITLRIQLGRAANAPDPHNVLIENWQIFEEVSQNPPATP